MPRPAALRESNVATRKPYSVSGLGERERLARRVRVRARVDRYQQRVLLGRVEVRRLVEHAVELGLAVGGLERDQLDLLAVRADSNFDRSLSASSAITLPVGIDQTCRGRDVVGLGDIDEVLAIGGDVDGVVERGVGQPRVAGAVEARRGEAGASSGCRRCGPCSRDGRLPRRDGRCADFERMVGQRREQLAAEVVEVKVLPAGAFGGPEEPLAVLEEPMSGLFSTQLAGHSSRTITRHLPVVRVGRDEFHDVLAAVGPVEE